MRIALVFVLLASCSSEDECAPAPFRVVDAAKGCVSKSTVGADCVVGSGPPTIRCSVGPDGKTYISYEGRIYPGGRACTADEEKAAGKPMCP